MRRMETEEVRLLKAVAGHGMTGHKCNEDAGEEMGIANVNLSVYSNSFRLCYAFHSVSGLDAKR